MRAVRLVRFARTEAWHGWPEGHELTACGKPIRDDSTVGLGEVTCHGCRTRNSLAAWLAKGPPEPRCYRPMWLVRKSRVRRRAT